MEKPIKLKTNYFIFFVLGIILLALPLRWNQPLYYDEVWGYFSPSYFLSENGWLAYFNKEYFQNQLFGRAPIYPLLMSIPLNIWGVDINPLRVLNFSIFLFLLLKVFKYFRFQKERFLLFLILFGISPIVFNFSTILVSDILTTLFFLLFWISLKQKKAAGIIGFGLILIFTRVNAIVLLGSICGGFLLNSFIEKKLKFEFKWSALVSFLTLIWFVPVYLTYGTPIVGFSQGGDLDPRAANIFENLRVFFLYLVLINIPLILVSLEWVKQQLKSKMLESIPVITCVLASLITLSIVGVSYPRYLIPVYGLFIFHICATVSFDTFLLEPKHRNILFGIFIGMQLLFLFPFKSTSPHENFDKVSVKFNQFFIDLNKIDPAKNVLIMSYIEKYVKTYGFEELLESQGQRANLFNSIIPYKDESSINQADYIVVGNWWYKKLLSQRAGEFKTVHIYSFISEPNIRILKRVDGKKDIK